MAKIIVVEGALDSIGKSTQFDLMVGIGCRLLNPTTHKYVPFVHAGLDINAWLTKKMDKDIIKFCKVCSTNISNSTGNNRFYKSSRSWSHK